MKQQLYDSSDPESIESFGKKLVGSSLRTTTGVKPIPSEQLDVPMFSATKGLVGKLVEEYYYGIKPGNVPCSPDFKDAGVELKTTSLKYGKGKVIVPKERLVFGMINYMNVHREDFHTSCFLQKNRRLMVLWYWHESNTPIGDLEFRVAKLVDFDGLPPVDQKLIRDDWEKIVNRVKSGEAELLGGEHTPTTYMDALTKGAAGKTNSQANSSARARPRAFAFKTEYVKGILKGELHNEQRIFETPDSVAGDGFEPGVLERFQPYLGLSEEEIAASIQMDTSIAKQNRARLARGIMGVQKAKVVEFERANILMKTIHHRKGKEPKQHMSFPAFRFMGEGSVLEEIWDTEDSDDEKMPTIKRTLLEQRFLFVVFEEAGGVSRLSNVRFWSMPEEDIERFVKSVWQRTRTAIQSGRLEGLPGSTFNYVCHIRQHAPTGATFPTPHNGVQARRCFWLDRRYIHDQIDN